MKIWNVVCAGLLLAGTGVFAEEVLVSWESNGVLVATGMEPGSTCTVERASDLSTPFMDVTSAVVGTSGVARTEVSLEQEASFFRVRVDAPPEVIPEGMVKIPGGTNSGINPLADDESYGYSYSETYSLTVESFFMDQYEVTKAKWDAVYDWAVTNGYSFDNAGLGKDLDHPVHTVNWHDCVKWCNARSEMESLKPCYTVNGSVYKIGQNSPACDVEVAGYRLPTSDEWEYAARGGLSGKRFPWGDTINHNYANYMANRSANSYDTSPYTSYTCHPSYDVGDYPYTSPAGSFSSNGYGLYDMSGNVWEWCNTTSGSNRTVRGESWGGAAGYARCGYEVWGNPDYEDLILGFRAVCR